MFDMSSPNFYYIYLKGFPLGVGVGGRVLQEREVGEGPFILIPPALDPSVMNISNKDIVHIILGKAILLSTDGTSLRY